MEGAGVGYNFSEMVVHYLAEFWGVDKVLLERYFYAMGRLVPKLREDFRANHLRLTHKQFEPFGYSCRLEVRDCFLYIHTWPEEGFMTLDVYGLDGLSAIRGYRACVDVYRPSEIAFTKARGST